MRILRLIWLLSSFLAIGSLVACGAEAQPFISGGQSAQRPDAANPKAPEGLSFQLHSDRFELNTPELMCKALLVVSGQVKAYSASRWNTPTGARPAGLADSESILRLGYRIYTPFTLGQFEILRDRRTATAAAKYQVVGGAVGGDTWDDDSFPRPQIGQPIVMVFVPAIDGVTGQLNQSTPVLYEAFTVDRQGDVLLKHRTVEQGKVTQPEVKIALGGLRSYLASCG